jgi:hypothetical protein
MYETKDSLCPVFGSWAWKTIFGVIFISLPSVRNHIDRTLRSNAHTANTGMLVHQQRFFGDDLLSPLTSSRSSICPRSAPTSNFALPLREHHPVELRFCMSAMPGGAPVGSPIWAGWERAALVHRQRPK